MFAVYSLNVEKFQGLSMVVTILWFLLSGCHVHQSSLNSEAHEEDSYAVGSGFDSLTGDSKNTCIKVTPQEPINPEESTNFEGGASALRINQVSVRYREVRSKFELAKHMDIAFGPYATASSKNDKLFNLRKIELLRKTHIDAFDIYLLMRVAALGEGKRMRDVVMQDDLKQLYKTDPEAFREKCGDFFIVGGLDFDERFVLFRLPADSAVERATKLRQLNVTTGVENGNDTFPESIGGRLVDLEAEVVFSNSQSYNHSDRKPSLGELIRDVQRIGLVSKNFLTTTYPISFSYQSVLSEDEDAVMTIWHDLNVKITNLGELLLKAESEAGNVSFVLKNLNRFNGTTEEELNKQASIYNGLRGLIEYLVKTCLSSSENCLKTPQIVLKPFVLPNYAREVKRIEVSFPEKVNYVPPLVSGDPEFHGNGPRVKIDVGLTNRRTSIDLDLAASFEETKSNWTVARGTHKFTIYTAPTGWHIKNIYSNMFWDGIVQYTDTDWEEDIFTTSLGRFALIGDTGRYEDAGTLTRVTAFFNYKFDIEIERD